MSGDETGSGKLVKIKGRQTLNSTYQIILLVVTVLAVYYPALHGGVNSIDDVHIIDAYGINGSLTLRDVLLPGRGFYYRPLIELTYYLDARLWGMEPVFMHLENVLIHALNTILVYLLARKILSLSANTPCAIPGLPLLSALLFALHPANAEAISWIAGRTDPLATVFVLCSALLLVKGLQEDRECLPYLSVLFLVLGVLAKEVAVFFLPVAIAMIYFWSRSCAVSKPGQAISQVLRRSAPFVAAAFAIFAALLAQGASSGSNAMLKLFEGADGTPYQNLLTALQIFGFYVKKLLAPEPLNFAIAHLSVYHWAAGLAAALALLVCSRQRHLSRLFIGASFFLITPALLAALFNISWTPVAERYLYLPSAFFCIGIIGLFDDVVYALQKPRLARLLAAAVCCVLVLAAFVTVQRNLVWRDNLTLYQDAVRQSPEFAPLRNELAVALLQKGRTVEAVRQLKIGQSLKPDPKVKFLIDYNLLLADLKGKSADQAWDLVHRAVPDKGKAESKLLLLFRTVEYRKLDATERQEERSSLMRDLIETQDHLYLKLKDATYLYINGKLAIRLGDRTAAADYFRRAYLAAPEGAHFKEAARKLAQKLSEH
ncbi:MAG: hypothetical protein FPO08_06700 [Geobacter sp.]|nr:MAG: hypothetical protein FPO08_06700 [Geobacter sp.]